MDIKGIRGLKDRLQSLAVFGGVLKDRPMAGLLEYLEEVAAGGGQGVRLYSQFVSLLYEENGGNPHLDGAYSTAGTGHTVFAQVFEGMDVVRESMQVETDDNDMPLTEVTILSAEIVPYE